MISKSSATNSRHHESWAASAVGRRDVLAGGLAGAEGGGLDGGCGLVVLVGLLDEKGDTALLAGDDADGLVYIINTVFYFHSVFALGATEDRGSRTLLAIEPSFCAESADAVQTSKLHAYLAAVEVPQVKRVARELDAICPLDERGAASLCRLSTPIPPQITTRSGHSLVISQARSCEMVVAIVSVWNVDTDEVVESSPILKERLSSALPHALSACFGDGSTKTPTSTLAPRSGAEVTTHQPEAQT